ncbi:hypothetical protein C8F04DRAFT_1126897 [Mycena alexandri]|uniref:J domain-containing protein n=1 Tax=Mycena alexandri TaxID=1745969 RepID=A0AAD6WWH7_9AGAR|nr:hypothetical protein C8F04DRAFT_1126897 [Mycena alexandri]
MGAAASRLDLDSMDLYAVLEISEDATSEDIKQAYRKKAREHHPDKNQDDVEGSTRRFKRVLEAYETLSNDNKRSDYDMRRESDISTEPEPSHKPPPPFTPPGAWTEEIKIKHTKSTGSWSEWLYGLAFRPEGYSRYAFRPEIYAANNQCLGPGITSHTVYDFYRSLRGLYFSKDDHSEASVFTIIENFFICIAIDEQLWHCADSHESRAYPRFGCGHFVWTRDDWDLSDGGLPQEVHRFYEFWSTFKTLKSFEWIAPYTCPQFVSAREERLCRKANKPYQERAKAEYNELIRKIVKALKEQDPRYLMHLEIQAQKHATRGQGAESGKKNKKKGKNKNKNKTTW